MFNLPIEIKLDLLKCLNFDQLFNFRLSNFYFNEFVNKNEEILARKEFYSIRIERYWDGREYTPIGDKVIELDFKFGYFLDYKLDDQLIGKWQSSLNQRQHLYFGELISRPQFKDNLVITIHQRTKDKKYFFRYLKFPLCPKNMEEMKIARYFLEQIFRCYFHFIDFGLYIFFPEMIKLLFENDKTTKLKFNGQKATLYYYDQINPLDFALNHLVINELFISFLKYKEAKNEDYNKSLINFLMNEGARFKKIKWDFYKIHRLFYSLIKQIETSTNCLNIVANIEVYASESFDIDLNVRAKNKNKNGEITSFELDNIYNPQVTFLVKHWEREEGKVYKIQIERINE